MHRTLKQETTRPPGMNILQQQARFEAFVSEFNAERQHEALDMACPPGMASAAYIEARPGRCLHERVGSSRCRGARQPVWPFLAPSRHDECCGTKVKEGFQADRLRRAPAGLSQKVPLQFTIP